jgi:uncharacterized protein (DUF4415 family)
MAKRKPMVAEDREVRELTVGDIRDFRPAAEVLAPDLYAGLVALKRQRGERGPQKAPVKQRISIRLSPEVVEQFRATGPGWQTRIDEVLKASLRTDKGEAA